MTEQYPFVVDRSFVPSISADGNVVWTTSNMDMSGISLSDTINESFVTACEDNTQYLSVLDSTGEITLDGLNITLTNPKHETHQQVETFAAAAAEPENAEQASEESNEQQVFVFSMEGSDDLYGIQLAQDEDGNVQKYQFQMRRNEEGQLEAIPETIQLLPLDEETPEDGVTTTEVFENPAPVADTFSEEIFAHDENSSEHILPDNIHEDETHGIEEPDESTLYEEEQEETADVKPGLISFHNVKQEMHEQEQEMREEIEQSFSNHPTFSVNIKQQHFDQEDESQESLQFLEHHPSEDLNDPIFAEEAAASDNLTKQMQPEISEEYSESLAVHAHHFMEQIDEATQERVPEIVEINPDVVVQTEIGEIQNFQQHQAVNNEDNESDAEDYHIVEGLHITGDVEDAGAAGVNDSGKHMPVGSTANILRHALKAPREIRMRKDRVYLYVIQHSEKENVESLASTDSSAYKPIVKANPRSILKSSFAMLQAKNQATEELKAQDKVNNRRFARGKEATQARMFHNFISKTTIPQAPVRKDRLPRKQQIKPVERMDEEIVVQEVMVSSNGFVEPYSGHYNKENDFEVMEYVDLTDSDEGYDPSMRKKKKKHKKRSDVASDTESVESVIDLLESDDELANPKSSNETEQEVPQSPKSSKKNDSEELTPTKRRRGRPPKNRNSLSQNSVESLDSPLKKMRLKSTSKSPEDVTEKVEIPCPKCDKSFPSQNSLKTHLQHHNLQSSLKNAMPISDKYKCTKCEQCFKNNALLTRHTCTKKYTCVVCKKIFETEQSLAAHKRMHAKEKLIKSTRVPVRVSPKKIKPKPSPPVFKLPKKITGTFKCKTCGKACSSLINLNTHSRTHKEFSCGTCSATFSSSIALEKHIRESCMKTPQSKRRSVRVQSLRSFNSDESDNESFLSVTRLTRSAGLKATCDECNMQFQTQKAMLQHKVKTHDFKIPDRAVGTEDIKSKDANKWRKDNCGIPANDKLKKAYADLHMAWDFAKNN